MPPDRPGTQETPLRVAVIGSGPSGFYAAEHLQEQEHLAIQVDMYDRLPTPFGLVRGGVAPDHQKIKSVTRVYDRIADHPEFRFYGNVEMGRDLTHADLAAYYHAIVYAVGARTDRRMGIPREHLPGSHSATEFVGWYNAHPDFRHLGFDLSSEAAVVVGNGNVAMDLARILASPADVLAGTDIAEHALEQLAASRIREIHVLGRRGPAQASFTNKELKELGELPGVDVVVTRPSWSWVPSSRRAWRPRPTAPGTATWRSCAATPRARRPGRRGGSCSTSSSRRRRSSAASASRPWWWPTTSSTRGGRHPAPPAHRAPLHAVHRAGLPRHRLPGGAAAGDPLRRHGGRDPQRGRADHGPAHRRAGAGRVRGRLDQARPRGIIGTNKPDSQETVRMLLEDLAAGRLDKPEVPSRAVLERLLAERRHDFVSYDDWQLIDLLEQERGAPATRPRVKYQPGVEEMLHALARAQARRSEDKPTGLRTTEGPDQLVDRVPARRDAPGRADRRLELLGGGPLAVGGP